MNIKIERRILIMGIVRQSLEEFKETANRKNIILFGAGNYAFRMLCLIGKSHNIHFICDNAKDKIGQQLCGIKIVSPSELSTVNPLDSVVVVTSHDVRGVVNQIEQYGDFDIYIARILLRSSFERISCELFDRLDQIDQVCNLLIDEKSKYIYKEVVWRRILYGETDFSDLIDGKEEYIFPEMYAESIPEHEVLIDCGAYIGDSLERFYRTYGGRLDKVYAFECGKPQFEQLTRKAEQMEMLPQCPQIILMPYGVSEKNEREEFVEHAKAGGSYIKRVGGSSLLEKENVVCNTIETVALDLVIPFEDKVTFIKMDIEGSEYNALLGARELIKRCKPRLAISIYHSGADYARLPLLIKELVPEYKFAVRHYKKKHVDTDLYAWI